MEVFRAEEQKLNSNEVFIIAERLRKGDVAIFPTDSVYTIACAFSSNSAMDKLCKLVGKKPGQANLSLICSSFEMISEFTLPFSTAIFRIMKQVLPGPFTFIFKANARKFRGYENRKHTVGIRMPDETFLIDVIKQLKEPLVCSSLHNEDEFLEYFTDPDEIEQKYFSEVDLFVSDGPGGFEPSTVVDCTGNEPIIIREGKGILH